MLSPLLLLLSLSSFAVDVGSVAAMFVVGVVLLFVCCWLFVVVWLLLVGCCWLLVVC